MVLLLKIAVIGIKGIPAKYGGFETCVEETSKRLINYGIDVTVYCRKNVTENYLDDFNGIKLKYISGINSKTLQQSALLFYLY